MMGRIDSKKKDNNGKERKYEKLQMITANLEIMNINTSKRNFKILPGIGKNREITFFSSISSTYFFLF